MDDRRIAELLSAQADRLNAGQRGAAAFPAGSEEDPSLVPLMELAERVQRTLAPVEPNPAFVGRLSRQLSMAMAEGSRAMSRRTRRAVLIVAATLGSAVSLASAVGVIVYLIRHRERRSRVQCRSET